VIERDDEREPVALPPEPIDRIGGPLARFLHIEAAARNPACSPYSQLLEWFGCQPE
jgi:hypothetical protein